MPKIIPALPRGVPWALPGWQRVYGIGPGSRVIWSLPLLHNAGQLYALMPAAAFGVSTVLMPKVDIRRMLELIEQHRVTHALSIGPIAPQLMAYQDIGKHDLSLLAAVLDHEPLGQPRRPPRGAVLQPVRNHRRAAARLGCGGPGVPPAPHPGRQRLPAGRGEAAGSGIRAGGGTGCCRRTVLSRPFHLAGLLRCAAGERNSLHQRRLLSHRRHGDARTSSMA